MKNIRPFLVPLAAFILIAIAVLGADGRPPFQTNFWTALGPASCYPHCFCEAFRAGGIVQPLSSYSNLFYILAGLLILGTRGVSMPGDGVNRMTRRRGYITGFGAAVIGIGATSMFFHVSLTQIGRWLDYMGMYAFVGYSLVYSLTRYRGWNGRTFLIVYTVLLTALGALWVLAPDFKRYPLAGMILALLAAEILIRRARPAMRIRAGYFYAALAIFLIAFAINVLDDGPLCMPASLWQWHAFWHFLTAVAAGLVYLYFRSENMGAGALGV